MASAPTGNRGARAQATAGQGAVGPRPSERVRSRLPQTRSPQPWPERGARAGRDGRSSCFPRAHRRLRFRFHSLKKGVCYPPQLLQKIIHGELLHLKNSRDFDVISISTKLQSFIVNEMWEKS